MEDKLRSVPQEPPMFQSGGETKLQPAVDATAFQSHLTNCIDVPQEVRSGRELYGEKAMASSPGTEYWLP